MGRFTLGPGVLDVFDSSKGDARGCGWLVGRSLVVVRSARDGEGAIIATCKV